MANKFVTEDKITSPIGRLSWVFIHKEDPKQKPNDAAKYKLTIMLPKNEAALASLGLNPKQNKAILAEVEQFKKEFEKEAMTVATAKFKAKAKATRWNPMLDGDDEKLSATWEGNKGFYIIRCKSKFQPTVIDRHKKPIECDDNPEGLYSGCWARIHLSLYPYDVDGNKGVAAGLGFFIKKIANDEAFGKGANADDAFDDDLDDELDMDDGEFDNDDLDDDDDELE